MTSPLTLPPLTACHRSMGCWWWNRKGEEGKKEEPEQGVGVRINWRRASGEDGRCGTVRVEMAKPGGRRQRAVKGDVTGAKVKPLGR